MARIIVVFVCSFLTGCSTPSGIMNVPAHVPDAKPTTRTEVGAFSKMNAAVFQRNKGNLNTALALLLEAHGLLAPGVSAVAKAAISNQLALTYFMQESYDNSIEYYGQAAQFAKTSGDETGQAVAILGLGDSYRRSGDKRAATQYWLQAETIAKSIGFRPLQKAARERIAEHGLEFD
jgi:tetratricopeptide (TPR) repeat protein